MQKDKIIDAMVAKQQNLVEELKKQVNQLKKGIDLDESDVILEDDLSHQDEPDELIIRYEERLTEAELNLRKIQLTTIEDHDVVEYGALLDLGDRYIYCCISVPEFEDNGKILLGISENSPLFLMLAGEKKGYKFELDNKHFEIKGIS